MPSSLWHQRVWEVRALVERLPDPGGEGWGRAAWRLLNHPRVRSSPRGTTNRETVEFQKPDRGDEQLCESVQKDDETAQ